MIRPAQIAQFPTLVRLHEGEATFRDGDQLTITMASEAWKAMGRPVDLQVIATPIDQGAANVGRVLKDRGMPVDETSAALLAAERQERRQVLADADARHEEEGL